MDIREIKRLNPWWEDKSSLLNDKHVRSFLSSHIHYLPFDWKRLDAGIYTLRGLRQIGKTTAMKVLIHRLLQEDVSTRSILWLVADNMKDRHELVQTLVDIIPLIDEGKKYIFIDEVSFIKNWQYAIKYVVDSGLIDTDVDVVMLSGSSSIDIYRGKERLPGRRGNGKDIVFLPITFRQFVSIYKGIDIPSLSLEEVLNMSEPELKRLWLEYAEFEKDFNVYKTVGGIPSIFNGYISGQSLDKYESVFADVIIGDIERFGKNRNILKRILAYVINTLGSRFSFSSLASEVEVHTLTAKDYIDILAYAYVLGIVHFIDISTKRIRPKKQKKVYPADVFLVNVLGRMTGVQANREGHLMEVIVYEHLLHMCDTLMGLTGENGPYFWYSDKGKEVDFVIGDIPIEVKYQKTINPSDYITMKRVWKRGIVLTRSDVGVDSGVVKIPIFLFLLLVDKY